MLRCTFQAANDTCLAVWLQVQEALRGLLHPEAMARLARAMEPGAQSLHLPACPPSSVVRPKLLFQIVSSHVLFIMNISPVYVAGSTGRQCWVCQRS